MLSYLVCLYIIYLTLRKKERPKVKGNLAIVIPAYLQNESLILPNTISRIHQAATRWHGEYRVIVVWNGPYCDYHEDEDAEYYHVLGSTSKAENLQFALELLTEWDPKYIAIYDADSYPAMGSLELLASRIEGKTICAQSSSIIECRSTNLAERLYIINHLLERRIWMPMMEFVGFCFFVGSGAIWDYQVLKKYGFRPHLTEDFELSCRVLGDGLNIVSVRDAITYETAPLTWQDILRQRVRWIQGNLELMFGQEQNSFRVFAFSLGALVITPIARLYYLLYSPHDYWFPLLVGASYLFLTGELKDVIPDIVLMPFFSIFHLFCIVKACVNITLGRREWIPTPR